MAQTISEMDSPCRLGRSRPGVRILVALLGLALTLTDCSKAPEHIPTPAVDRRHLSAEVCQAISAAGGDQVWIKKGNAGGKSDSGGEQPTEVLVARPAWGFVVQAVERTASARGLICQHNPKASAEGNTDVLRLSLRGRVYSTWKLQEVARLYRAAIIIDDLGQDLEAAHKLMQLPYPLTFSVLPYLRYSKETAQEAHRIGREVMLHLPMEPVPGSGADPGQGAIRIGMSAVNVEETVDSDFRSVPFAEGTNNHMGSRATADSRLMAEVMEELRKRHAYFIDSRTTASSTALDAARAQDVPTFFRSVFLDDEETVAYTLGQLEQFQKIIEARGVGIAIGHPHPTTIAALARFLPQFSNSNIQLVYASQVVHLPEVSSLSPAAHAVP